MDKVNRNRLENVMIYFAKNTLACGKVKLFKLLYLLDFEHFTLTGRSVTGLGYHAWELGPVPIELAEAWEEFSSNFGNKLFIEVERVISYDRQAVKVVQGVEFDDIDFTPRQLNMMSRLVEKYRDTASPALIDVTHEQNGAWHRVWTSENGKYQAIPYDFSLSDPASELAQQVVSIAQEDAMYSAALEDSRLKQCIH